jgi:hypothetical protein
MIAPFVMRTSCKRIACSGLAILMLIICRSPSWGAKNLLHNGDFVVGSGDSVDGWRTDAWILTPGTTDYRWIPPAKGQPGEVEVFSLRDNDARWLQSLSLGPGWYYMSVDIRTHGVLPFFTGASISVLEDAIMSQDLRGDNDWRRVGLYLKIGPYNADVDVVLRVGGYMNLTRGEAFFRNAQVVKVAAPPHGAQHVFDLVAIRKQATAGPIGHLWTLVATFLGLFLLAIIGWWLMSEPPSEISSARRIPSRRVGSGRS